MRRPEKLIERLQSHNPKIRQQAAEQIGDLRMASALEPLIECLRDPVDLVQVAAATALGQLEDVRAVEPLIRSFHGETYSLIDRDGSPGLYFRVVASAARALGHIGTAVAVDALLAQLERDNPLNDLGTAAAADGLVPVQDTRVFPALLKILDSPSHFVRDYAASALGRRRETGAVEALLQVLHDRVWTVQVSAAEALGTIGDARAIPSFQAVFERVESYVDESDVPARFRSNDAHIHLRAQAARGLGLIATAESLQILEDTLFSAVREVKVFAAIGLAYRKDRRVFQVLAEALQEKETALRIEAIEALAALGDERAVPLLERVKRNRHIPILVTDAACQSLKKLQ